MAAGLTCKKPAVRKLRAKVDLNQKKGVVKNNALWEFNDMGVLLFEMVF